MSSDCDGSVSVFAVGGWVALDLAMASITTNTPRHWLKTLRKCINHYYLQCCLHHREPSVRLGL